MVVKTQHIPLVINPMPITANSTITVLYNGFLNDRKTDKIFIRTGSGSYYEWKDINEYPMKKTIRGWMAKIKVKDSKRLNLCFKDANGNWDNNNGANWSFEVHNG